MNKEKLRKIPHIFSGVIILLHSLERFEMLHSTWILFFLAGITFLSVAFFHHRLSQRFPKIDILFYSIESLLAFTIAYEFYEAGKKSLPYMYVIAGLFQLFAIAMFTVRMKKKHKDNNGAAA